ncbi:hypothetical protein HOD29_00765 [archaeon]|nr:hypothetical protein [archaeon]
MKKNWKYYLCSSKIHQKEGINKVDPITQPICYKKGNPEKCPWFKKENKLEKEAKEK